MCSRNYTRDRLHFTLQLYVVYTITNDTFIFNHIITHTCIMQNGSVSVESTQSEQVHLQELVRTDDALFDRIIIIFASLCDEMDQLTNVAHQKYFPTLAVFGTSFDKTASTTKESAEMRISRMLPWLQSLSNYIERCCDVVANVGKLSYLNIYLLLLFQKFPFVLHPRGFFLGVCMYVCYAIQSTNWLHSQCIIETSR